MIVGFGDLGTVGGGCAGRVHDAARLRSSSHQGHALHLRDLREVLQAQHVPQGPFTAALGGEAFQMRGKVPSLGRHFFVLL